MMESTEVERAATRATLPRDTRREVERRTRKQTNPHFVSEQRKDHPRDRRHTAGRHDTRLASCKSANHAIVSRPMESMDNKYGGS